MNFSGSVTSDMGLDKDLIFLILQFLEEENMSEAVHKIEKDSKVFFNMKYFHEKILVGDWEEVEDYLSGFTKLEDNKYSMKIFFEIRKQKYLEALDRPDKGKAVEILAKDLKVFKSFNGELYKQCTELITYENFREDAHLTRYGETNSGRRLMLQELKTLIEANPILGDKLVFPSMRKSRLRTLINQSLNWQHQLCVNQQRNPNITTLFKDHTCRAPLTVNRPVAGVARQSAYIPHGGHNNFAPHAVAASRSGLAGSMTNTSRSPAASGFKRPRTPATTASIVDLQSPEDPFPKRLHTVQFEMEVTPAPRPRMQHPMDILPTKLERTLHQGSTVTSMAFHPRHATFLLVGCATGEVVVWEVALPKRLVSKPFHIWNMETCSSSLQNLDIKISLQDSGVTDPHLSVSRVAWSPDGGFVGVAFTKDLFQLYAYTRLRELTEKMQVDAHVGAVNDLAFAQQSEQLCVVTCGDDKLVKVWDIRGRKLFTFEGHESSVCSICPNIKEFILSTSLDGKIKSWLYDDFGCRATYTAPGRWCTALLYSGDGNRLFSCGTNKDGESYLSELKTSEGMTVRNYTGFRNRSAGPVMYFDTTQNHFLAAGEDGLIKYWDMDKAHVLFSTDAGGGLPAFPQLRFNRNGGLLAVTTEDNGFKILSNAAGTRSLRAIENNRFFNSSRSPGETSATKNTSRISESTRTVDDVIDTPRTTENPIIINDEIQVNAEIMKPTHCRSLTLPDCFDTPTKVGRVRYTNDGDGILAIGSNGIQKVWRWRPNEQNPSGKASASIIPRVWKPEGIIMANDMVDVNIEEAVPCIDLTNKDSYIMSATGGKVTVFSIATFKVIATFKLPRAPTYLAFTPLNNNIAAIGMEDSNIMIYNIRNEEVISVMKGHRQRITGFAFSIKLNILVSSGADAQLCVWSMDKWEIKNSVFIQIPSGKGAIGDTRVQFHSDQTRLLVVHETHLAVYDASKLEQIIQWVGRDELSAPITSAAYSCDSQLIYGTFADGCIVVFEAATLMPRCRIAPAAYLSQERVRKGKRMVCVNSIAAHPSVPDQFAIGLTDGIVKVIEPAQSDNNKWRAYVPPEASTSAPDVIYVDPSPQS